MKMDICTDLPHEVHGIEYVVNDHYIRLTDCDGNVILLWAKKIQYGKCPSCAFTLYVEDRSDILCPKCNIVMNWVWGEEQLCFVPEEESDFLKGKKQ